MGVPKPATRRFRFDVRPDGTLQYDPPGEWGYNRHDTIEYFCPDGPFTIDFQPENAPAIPGFNPLGGPLTATPVAGGFMAKTTVNDGLSDARRDAIWNANRPVGGGPGFVAKYRYYIDGESKTGGVFHAEDRIGVFVC